MNKHDIGSSPHHEAIAKLVISDQGLSAEEAAMRTRQYGPNELRRGSNTLLRILGRQFKSPLVYLFVVAALLSFFLKDFTDGVVITVILILNAFLGFFQEYRSEKTIEKLSKLIERQVFVIRGGKTVLLSEKVLVPGDIVLLRAGDIVPADMSLLQADDLTVNESQLTGESVPVVKTAQTNEGEKNTSATMIFAGSVIERGIGKGVVVAIANSTRLGKIAKLSTQTKRVTQYERSLQNFSGYLMRVILLTLTLIFFGKLLILHNLSQVTTLLLFVIALAVTVIPEALPVIAIVTLSQGALKLAKRKVVVKRLSSLEDLGNVNLLCTDKTGTLTENKMKVAKAFAQDYELFDKLAFATIEDLKVRKKHLTNSFDDAFRTYVPEKIKVAVAAWQQIKEVPFDPLARRRRMVLFDPDSRKYFLVVIGSVETLLKISSCAKKTEYLKIVDSDGKQGIRHLGIAYKMMSAGTDFYHFDILKHEDDLHFVGFVQLVDPLRPSAKQSIELAEKLGIHIKILTGDSKEVAGFVGRQVGLLADNDVIFDGDEIEKMTGLELKEAVEKCAVFARITPEQKYKIIELLKQNHVVGYQGDGINDAPSLKLADVAIAVNTATDVAKDSSDIVLMEADLGVIISGIHYGRSIFVNINKYIKHTMVGNLGSFFSLAILYLVAFQLPQLPIQLLLANLIQDIPLITVYSDSVDDAEVKRPEQYNIRSIMLISLFLGGFSAIYNFIFLAFVGFKVTPYTQTMLFLYFIFTQLIVILSVRNKMHMWQGRKPSLLVLGSIILFAALALVVVYIPFTQRLFSFSSLSLTTLGEIIVISLVYIFSLDFIKVFYFKMIHRSDVARSANLAKTV